MRLLLPGSIAILPPGALGVAFFYHLTQGLTQLNQPIRFLGLTGSPSVRSLKEAGILRIRSQETTVELPIADRVDADLQETYRQKQLPQIILIATNPDQLYRVVDEMISLLEQLHNDQRLNDHLLPFPVFIFCANGIYFQRLRQVFIEKLEESTLLGRLPDLWPDLMPRLIGRMMRGVTIQAGLRDGNGSTAIYQPGQSAITRIVGGDAQERKSSVDLLRAKGAWFEPVDDLTATRVEFDKAMITLTGNLLGIIYATSPEGRFTPLTIGEIFSLEHRGEIEQLANEVLKVGQAVKAYSAHESLNRIMADLDKMAETHRDHVPSSLQYISMLLAQGRLKGECTPTEEWLLQPLIKYADSAGLRESSLYLQGIRERLIDRLNLAAGEAEAESLPQEPREPNRN